MARKTFDDGIDWPFIVDVSFEVDCNTWIMTVSIGHGSNSHTYDLKDKYTRGMLMCYEYQCNYTRDYVLRVLKAYRKQDVGDLKR